MLRLSDLLISAAVTFAWTTATAQTSSPARPPGMLGLELGQRVDSVAPCAPSRPGSPLPTTVCLDAVRSERWIDGSSWADLYTVFVPAEHRPRWAGTFTATVVDGVFVRLVLLTPTTRTDDHHDILKDTQDRFGAPLPSTLPLDAGGAVIWETPQWRAVYGRGLSISLERRLPPRSPTASPRL